MATPLGKAWELIRRIKRGEATDARASLNGAVLTISDSELSIDLDLRYFDRGFLCKVLRYE